MIGRLLILSLAGTYAQVSPSISRRECSQLPVGSTFNDQSHIFSKSGVLKQDLSFYAEKNDDGNMEYCYMSNQGERSPVFHLLPGDRLLLNVTNRILVPKDKNSDHEGMSASDINIHFHGLGVSPAYHQDNVLKTVIHPGETFNYDVYIPTTQPPGIYWYHAHIHPESEKQLLGGASGMIVIEGIERVRPILSGLVIRTFTMRDIALPEDEKSDDRAPPYDLSVNFIPVKYPNYEPVKIFMPPLSKEFWRVANAGAETHLNLQLLYHGEPQQLQVIALDGSPLEVPGGVENVTSIILTPGARAEFIVIGPKTSSVNASLQTLSVDTGPLGDKTPTRPLAKIFVLNNYSVPTLPRFPSIPEKHDHYNISGDQKIIPHLTVQELLAAQPNVTRTLYFTEATSGDKNDNNPTKFYITVLGEKPVLFNKSEPPAIVVDAGTVEDWVILNAATEVHSFHIHQVHFLLLEENGVAFPNQKVEFLDTYLLDYWNGSSAYPSIHVRMYFPPITVGEFIYHCHIADHQDGGMMAKIVVRSSPLTSPDNSSKELDIQQSSGNQAWRCSSWLLYLVACFAAYCALW